MLSVVVNPAPVDLSTDQCVVSVYLQLRKALSRPLSDQCAV